MPAMRHWPMPHEMPSAGGGQRGGDVVGAFDVASLAVKDDAAANESDAGDHSLNHP
jgi:hypothetical protein